MTGVIGFDIDGRPLRVGDAFVVVSVLSDTKQLKPGAKGVVTGKWLDGVDSDIPDLDSGCDTYWFPCEDIRKIHNDHLPAPQTYEQLINSLKGETA